MGNVALYYFNLNLSVIRHKFIEDLDTSNILHKILHPYVQCLWVYSLRRLVHKWGLGHAIGLFL